MKKKYLGNIAPGREQYVDKGSEITRLMREEN